jgi:hypothetical protein
VRSTLASVTRARAYPHTATTASVCRVRDSLGWRPRPKWPRPPSTATTWMGANRLDNTTHTHAQRAERSALLATPPAAPTNAPEIARSTSIHTGAPRMHSSCSTRSASSQLHDELICRERSARRGDRHRLTQRRHVKGERIKWEKIAAEPSVAAAHRRAAPPVTAAAHTHTHTCTRRCGSRNACAE